MFRKHKRVIIVALSCGLILSSFGSITTGLAAEVINKINGKPAPDSSVQAPLKIAPPAEQHAVTQTVYGNLPVVTPDAASLAFHHPDKYSFSNEEVYHLMQQGFTVEDLVYSDNLGNELDVDPKIILQDHKNHPQAWSQLEQEMKATKFAPITNKLKKKHPAEAKLLEGESFTAEEQLNLLSVIDQHLVPSMANIIASYKKEGQRSIDKAITENKFYGHMSPERMKKYHLSEDDVQNMRLSDEDLTQVEQDENNGKNTVKQYLEFKRNKNQARGQKTK